MVMTKNRLKISRTDRVNDYMKEYSDNDRD